MTLALDYLTVIHSITHLSISGVTILDIDQIPDSADMLGPILFPHPIQAMSEGQPTRITFGTMGSQHENFTYTLNYVFLYCPVGGNLSAFTSHKAAHTMAKLIINTILNNDVVTGLEDMRLKSYGGIGVIGDPPDTQYWGSLFSFACLEYTE